MFGGRGVQVKFADHSDQVERVQREAIEDGLITLSGAFADELAATLGTQVT